MSKKSIIKEKWKLFINSFKLKSNFIYIALYDLLFYSVMILFILFSNILEKKSAAIDPDILSKLTSAVNVTAAQTQELQQMAQSMQSFIYFLIFGIIFLTIAALLIYTLSRTLIWNNLLEKKFDLKKYLKFNVLNIVFAVILGIILYIILRLRMSVMLFLVDISIDFALIVSSILFLIIFTAISYFSSLLYINYTLKPEIFNSFSRTFKLIKNKFQNISYSYLFIFITAILASLIARIFWLVPFQIQQYSNIVIVILFAAWMRIYILNVIKK
ncbi:hypothetical protein KY343_00585 [Candidatus Woesearchaeota archaeon]|nr:hypothetical protein [Candidatus Woesearchaeota archaeon]